MPGAALASFLDAVGVVPGALDDPRVGPVPSLGLRLRLRVMSAMTAARAALRGSRGKATAAMARRTVRVNLTASRSMSASVAAWQIRADRA